MIQQNIMIRLNKFRLNIHLVKEFFLALKIYFLIKNIINKLILQSNFYFKGILKNKKLYLYLRYIWIKSTD